MAFGNEAQPTRKYVYGTRNSPPGSRHLFDGHTDAVEQLFLAHKFQNKLVELECARREACERTIREFAPDLATLETTANAQAAERDRLATELSQSNSANRQRNADRDLARRVREQRAATTAAWAAFRVRRTAVYADPGVRSQLDAVDAEHHAQVLAARTAAIEGGLYWATIAQVGPRVKRSGPPPKFKKWMGEGSLSVQFQRKPDRASARVPVLDDDGNPRLHPRTRKPMLRHEAGGSLMTDQIWTPNTLCYLSPRCDKRTDRVWIHFRVRSDAKGNPVWAKIPTILHRPLPEKAEVKWVHLHRTKYGTKYRWELHFDVAKPKWEGKHPRAESGVVAVSLGWRRLNGLRVAVWEGDDGQTGELHIPERRVATWKGCDDLQSVRDTVFDRSHAALCAFVRGRELTPEWVERTENLPHWQSPAVLARFIIWWRTHRIPEDEVVWGICEGLREGDHYTGGRLQDKHLYDWQEFRRARCRRWRKHYYHRIALELAAKYKTVVVGDIDWHAIAENPEVGEEDELVNKTYRGISACATFRDHLEVCMTETVRENAEYATRDCYVCGHRCPDPGAGRWIVCEPCGNVRRDRAENHAKNLLQRYLQRQPVG